MKFEQNFSQQQKQTQKLAMTQKLQQSIQILQFSVDELTEFVTNEALDNPLIEVSEANYTLNYRKPRGSSGEEMQYLSQIPDEHVSLFEYLLEQVHLNYRDTYLRKLVLFLVEYIDLNGYLKITLAEACEKTGAESIQMLDALTLIQRLDPAGVGARDLQECLMLQIERDDHAPALAYLVLEEYFSELVNRKWEQISKKLAIPLTDVQQIFDYLQTLTPTPGAAFGSTEGLYIVPDLTVKVEEGKIKLISNRAGMPDIKFQQNYFQQMAKSQDPEVLNYLKGKQQDFEWLQKTIQQRGDTIFRVGEAIVHHQTDFFIQEDRPLQPLVLREIAEELGIHESTVSRAVNGKYLETDFGVFELKTFFSQNLNSKKNGEDLSSDTARKKIKELIDREDKHKPLSDQKIVDALKADGLELSRRTVAKYRDQLKIPSSSKRKRFD